MNTSHGFVGATCNALSTVAYAVLAHVSASALLPQTGYLLARRDNHQLGLS